MSNKKKNRAGKKEKIREQAKAHKQSRMLVGVAVIAIALMGVGMGFSLIDNDGGQTKYSDPTGTTETAVMIPISDITTDAKHYQETIDGVTVKFFIIEGSDGQIHTAFDACDVCYGEKKGYTQDDAVMTCNNCGNQYATNGIGSENSAGGGCWPGYLRTSVEGDNLVIERSELAKGTYYFE